MLQVIMYTKGNYLKLIIGPMFSSKSSYLLSEINKMKHITDKILVINSILDKERHANTYKEFKFNWQGMIKTHDNEILPALMVDKLQELKDDPFFKVKYRHADVIIIDEAQFYKDLYEFVASELSNNLNNKKFIIAGLSSDFNMKPIGDIIKLVPIADDIVKLSALCLYCKDGTPANFTKLIKQSNNTQNNILVGSNDYYEPCCRTHFFT